jgi:hypothetical protein
MGMNKSTVVALLVFIGLAVVVANTMREKPERGITRLSLAQVDAAAVDAVLIGADDGIRLEKKDGRWQLDGKRADQTAIERVIESVAKVQSSDLASRNPERYAEFEVDEEKGTRVRLYTGSAPVADLIVGGAARGGSYLRSGDEVYTAPGIYRASFARDRAGWVERRVFFDEVGDIARVEVQLHGEQPYALVARDGAWRLDEGTSLPEGQRFDADAASRLVQSLATARADEVLDGEPDQPTGLGEEADRFVYRLAGDESERTLLLGATVDSSVYARSSARDHLLTLRTSVAEGLRKSLDDLRDWNIVRLDPQQVKRLSIENGEERLVLENREGTWAIDEATPAAAADFVFDPGTVRRRLTDLGRMRAVAESESAAPLDAASAQQKVTATLNDDTTVTVAFGAEVPWQERTVVQAIANADAGTYLVEKAVRDQLLGGLQSFARVEPVAPAMGNLGGLDPEALKNLPPEVRDSLLRQMAEEQQRQEMMRRAMEAQGAGN